MYPCYVICLRAHTYSLEMDEMKIQNVDFLMKNQ